MAKLTILQKVQQAKAKLLGMSTHTQLREWAKENELATQAAFPRFKKALLEIGRDYDKIKQQPIVTDRQLSLIKEKMDAGVKLDLDECCMWLGGSLTDTTSGKRIYLNQTCREFVWNGSKQRCNAHIKILFPEPSVTTWFPSGIEAAEKEFKLQCNIMLNFVRKHHYQLPVLTTATNTVEFTGEISKEPEPEIIVEHYSINI